MRRRAELAVAVALAVVLAGCARVGPPGGGPEDTTPPEVTSVTPEDGTTFVARDTEIRIEFSEEMTRVSAERSFSLEPRVDLKGLRWEGTALVARTAAELPDSTTFTVRVAETASDYHGVAMESAFSSTFSTGASLDTGVISGTVTLMGAGESRVTVWACEGTPAPVNGVMEPCRYAALTGEDGTFRIGHVAVSDRPYVLIAFFDTNEDGVFDVIEETGMVAQAAALIDSTGGEATGILIELAGAVEGGWPTEGEED
jgi:hypothetical protein